MRDKKICKACGEPRGLLDKKGICILCKVGQGKGIEKKFTPMSLNAKVRKSVELTPEKVK